MSTCNLNIKLFDIEMIAIVWRDLYPEYGEDTGIQHVKIYPQGRVG